MLRCSIAVLFLITVASSQWKQLAGPEGGTVMALAGSGDTLFAGTKGGGVFRTFNGGVQWSGVNNGITKFDIEALAVSGQTVYAGGYNTEGGFFVSTDLGASWTERSAAFNSKYIRTILKSGSTLLVGTYGYGLFRSTDDGAAWKKIDSGMTATAITSLHKQNGIVYAGTISGVFVSADDGISWTLRSTGMTTLFTNALTGKDSMVYAGTTNGIFMTTNAGQSWTAKNNGLVFSVIYAMGFSGGKLLAASNASVCFSNNNGDNWNNPVSNNGMSGYTVTPAMLVSGNTVYAATMYDVYRSDNNGINWVKRTAGINAGSSPGLLAAPSGLYTSYGTYGIKRSSDWGRSWRNSDSTLFIQVKSFFAGSQNLHAAGASGGLFHSTDQGGKWINDSLPSGVSVIATGWARIGSTMFISDNGKGIFKSTNNGVKWTAATTDIAMPKNVWSLLAVDTVLYAGSTAGLHRSTTGGNSWEPYNGGNTTLQNAVVNNLVYADGKMYASTLELGVFISTNRGASWRPFGTPVQTNVSSFATNANRVFAVTPKDGILLLKDTVWTPFKTGLPTTQIGALQFAGDTMYASTLGMGLWKRPFSDVALGIRTAASAQPEVFTLEQNYPNPFNPETAISYQLSEAGVVTLTVHDLLGREVATLVHQEQASGAYSVRFDASGLASGVYLYSLRAGNTVQSRRMLLLK